MIKQFLALILIIGVFAFAGCSSDPSGNTSVATGDTLKENLLESNSIAKIVAARHAQLIGVKGNLQSFKKYIADLGKEKITVLNGFTNISIAPLAFDYINTCIPVMENGDSVFYYFNKLFYATADHLSDSLYTPVHDSLMRHLDAGLQTPDVVAFTQNLTICGMAVFNFEGEPYVDLSPGYFYTNFKNRVSKGLSNYLEIRVDEIENPYEIDGGLISFEDLYKRAKRWERFLNDYPHSFAEKEASNLYATYVEALFNGADNTPVFEGDADSLLPEVKTLYEKIATEEPESKTSKLVTAYYEFLARDNFRRTENTGQFIIDAGLDSMLAVQPNLR